jgi:sugar/nucleoside kinase (ribokinase family)
MDVAVFGIIVAEISGSDKSSVALRAGGNACNIALAVAQMGMKAAAAGMIGDDLLGRAVLHELKDSGVDVTCVYANANAQTHARILTESSKSDAINTLGVTQLIDGETFRKSFEFFKRCAWLAIGRLHQMPKLTSALPDLLAELHAEAPGTSIALDLQDDSDLKSISATLAHLDLLVVSRATPIRSIRSVMPKGIIARRLDDQGCALDDGIQQAKASAYRASVSDSSITADIWLAALMCGLRKKLSLEQVCKIANRAAADWEETGKLKSFPDMLAGIEKQ